VVVACSNADLGARRVYADDIILITKSVSTLQNLFDIVQAELDECSMCLNVGKYCAMRVEPRYNSAYAF
jgi:hypothetical protein